MAILLIGLVQQYLCITLHAFDSLIRVTRLEKMGPDIMSNPLSSNSTELRLMVDVF